MRPFCAGFRPLLAGHQPSSDSNGTFHTCFPKSGCPCESHTYFLFHFNHQALIPHLTVSWDYLLLPPNSQKFVSFHLPGFKALAKVSHKVSQFFFLEQRGSGRGYGTRVLLIQSGPRSYIIWWVRNTIFQSDDKRVNLHIAMEEITRRGKNVLWKYCDLVGIWQLWLSPFQHRMADECALS